MEKGECGEDKHDEEERVGGLGVGGADLASSLYGEVGRVAAQERSRRRGKINVQLCFQLLSRQK